MSTALSLVFILALFIGSETDLPAEPSATEYEALGLADDGDEWFPAQHGRGRSSSEDTGSAPPDPPDNPPPPPIKK